MAYHVGLPGCGNIKLCSLCIWSTLKFLMLKSPSEIQVLRSRHMIFWKNFSEQFDVYFLITKCVTENYKALVRKYTTTVPWPVFKYN